MITSFSGANNPRKLKITIFVIYNYTRLKWIIPIRIIDDETLIRAYVGLYDKNMVNNDNLVSYYRIYAGEIFGYLDYMGYDNISTYYKAGNKIILSNGDIYTIVDGGLVREGYSMSEVMTNMTRLKFISNKWRTIFLCI